MTNKENLTERAKNGRNGVQLVYVIDCIKNSRKPFTVRGGSKMAITQ